MSEEMITYLIGLIPSLSVVIGMVPVVFKVFSWVKKIVKRDNSTQDQVNQLIKKLDQIILDNQMIRKENLALRRQNNKLMAKITKVETEDKEE